MRVVYDLFRDGLSAVNTAAGQLEAARQQVATGRRISVASDDPLGMQQSVIEHSTLAALDAYTRSRDSAAARLAAADNVLNSIVDKISSAVVAGTGARGSEVDATARAALSQTVRSLRDSLVGDINSKFNGSYLFSGTEADTASYAQVAGVWTYQGNAATTQVEVEQGRLVSTSFDGQSLVKGSDASDLFSTLDALAAAIDAGDNDAIGTALSGLDRAFDRALQAQGRLGADERGVDDATARLSALKIAADTRRASLEQVDLAAALTKMSQADTAYRAALGAVSTAERVSLLDYLR